MQKIESLDEFYQQNFNQLPDRLQSTRGQANVFRLEECLAPSAKPVSYSRRDFYKITLIRGHNVYHYADKSIEVDGPTLIFLTPRYPIPGSPYRATRPDFSAFFAKNSSTAGSAPA